MSERAHSVGQGPADGGVGDAGAVRPSPHPRRWRVLAVSLVVAFMSLLDVTLVNIAVPSMRAALDTTPAAILWVVSGYSLRNRNKIT